MTARIFLLMAMLTLSCGEVRGQDDRRPEQALASRIDAYLRPYVESANFSGVVLAEQDGKLLFFKGYGFADRENKVPNIPATRFHVASVSMQFTAAAVLRLVDEGRLSLDTPVGEFVPGTRGAEKITVRDLLRERSGLQDVNSLPEYSDLLTRHQTPASLVAKIAGRPLLFEPGAQFLHEEHSAYNLLALLVEKKTGLPFAAAVERLVFRPAGLRGSQVDDDSLPASEEIAVGYQPEGVYGLRRAMTIHWSGKTGNASLVMTAEDEAKWVDALVDGKFLLASSREAALELSPDVGYGWFKRANKRFDEMTYFMNGRAPGFGSFVLYLPREKVTVVVFGNIYSSAATSVGYDLAAIVCGLPYQAFHTSDPPPSAGELASSTGRFQFGQDFYQPNAEVALVTEGRELSLRWPGGSLSPLLPVGKDQFVDRAYWEQVRVERDTKGQPTGLAYGSFHGRAVGASRE